MSGNKPKSWLLRGLDFLFGFFADKSAEPKGAKFKIGFHREIGSGYNTAMDRAERKQRLKDICITVLADPDMVQEGAVTWCNRGNGIIAAHMGCFEITEFMLAKEQIEEARGSSKFIQGTAEEAAAHAKEGGYGFAGRIYEDSAHVDAIYPTDTKHSGSWDKQVPLVAHIGRAPNGIMRASEAFPVSEPEPVYFLYGET